MALTGQMLLRLPKKRCLSRCASAYVSPARDFLACADRFIRIVCRLLQVIHCRRDRSLFRLCPGQMSSSFPENRSAMNRYLPRTEPAGILSVRKGTGPADAPSPVLLPIKKAPAFGEPPGPFKERESIGCFQYEIKKSAPPYRFSGDSSRSGETPKHIDSWSTIDIILRVNFSDKTLFEKLYQKSAAFPALFCSYIWALSSAIKLCAGTAPIMR